MSYSVVPSKREIIFMNGPIHLKTDLQNSIHNAEIVGKVYFVKSDGKARKC